MLFPTSPDTKRRKPSQRRAVQTVESVLDAALQIAKQEGAQAVNTNRVAEIAGVSVGSLYQYFPDKHAIYAALHQRHLDELDRAIGRSLVESVGGGFSDFVHGLVETVFEIHSRDEGLYQLLSAESPVDAMGPAKFKKRLEAAFRIAISSRPSQFKPDPGLDLTSFVLATMLEALAQASANGLSSGLSTESVRAETVRAILRYLQS